MTNPLMSALKDAVTRGTKFKISQQGDAEVVSFSVTGGVSDIVLRIPFKVLKDTDGEPKTVNDFKWESTPHVAEILISAIESLPEDSEPMFLVNFKEWYEGVLILKGFWKQKKGGRSKETTDHHRIFLVDAGLLS